jgi:hypothetical protein
MNVILSCWFRPALAVVASAALLSGGMVHAETHWNLQAVDTNGVSTWNGSYPFTVTGVLLCDMEEMLDSTPNFLPWNDGDNIYAMGGEWQITVQATETGDRGGTTCWMGQCYGNMPWEHDSALSYSNEAWTAEINRLNYDPTSGHKFAKGDLVQITARGTAFYGGKRNINEEHSIDSSLNFDLSLVQTNYGLPAPEVITLADVVKVDDGNAATHEDIFDATRATGGEHWQGMRVRINGLTLVTTNGWNSTNLWGARIVTATDGAGRNFTLRTPRYSLGAIPTGTFDAIGIFTQESGSGTDGTFGYELFTQQIITQETTPNLAIALNAVISWPVSAGTYLLQSRSSVDSGEWQTVTNASIVSGGQNIVILSPASTQMFYQLKKAE